MNEKFNTLIQQKPWVIPTSVGVAGFSVGCAVGYLVARRQYKFLQRDMAELDMKHEAIMSTLEENQMKLDFTTAMLDQIRYDDIVADYKPEPEPEEPKRTIDIHEVAPEVDYTVPDIPVLREIPVEEVPDEPMPVEVVRQNVFETPDDVWDWEAERSTRSHDIPYVLHVEEYEESEMGFDQITLTYYMGDDIVTDDNDVPVYRHQNIIGDRVRELFGHGSQDANVVYIRNENLRAEYEVLRDNGSYEVDVIGLQVENALAREDLQHSRHRVLKFKEHD